MATKKATMEPDPTMEPEAVEQELPPQTEEFDEEIDLEEEYDSRSMPPDEELYPGGPTFGVINQWKDQFGDVYVASITPTYHVLWRTLTRFEYRRLTKNVEQAMASGMTAAEANLDNEEAIAQMCILHPPYDRTQSINQMAGVASSIAELVMRYSAFEPLEIRQL